MEPKEPDSGLAAAERLAADRFAAQGEDILATVMVYAGKPSRLEFLVKRLDLPCGSSLESRLDALRDYGLAQGWERFARRLRYEQWKALRNDPEADTVAREIFNSLVRLEERCGTNRENETGGGGGGVS